jgi:hypothetical protein
MRKNLENIKGYKMKNILRTILILFVVTSIYAQSPADNATGVSVTTNFSFTAVVVPPNTRIQVSTTTAFNPVDLVINQNLGNGANSYTFVAGDLINALAGQSNFAYNTTYYWRIRNVDANTTVEPGGVGYYTFTTVPTAPTLSTPADLASNILLNTTFTWNAVAGGNFYELQVNDDNTFTNAAEFAPAPGNYTTSAAATGLSNNTVYYWRVRASNDGGVSYGAWSSSRSFTTIVGAPSLTTPADVAPNIALNTTFTWGAVAGANFYQLEVNDDNTFTNAAEFAPAAGNYTTSGAATGLSGSTTYYWRVRASGDGGVTYGDWSTIFSFTTVLAPPTLTTPADAAVNIAVNTTFTWNAAGGANFYELEVNDDNTFTDAPEFAPAGGNYTTSPAAAGLLNNTVYYWRVRASNDGGLTFSTWSGAFSFTTTGTPTLTTPANAATNIAVNTTFTWLGVSGANFYELQVNDDNTFTNAAEFAPAPGNYTTSPATAGLSSSTVYYWRVRASFDGGVTYGAWSSTSSFTTAFGVPTAGTPADGTLDMAINTTFTWGAVAGANFYELQVNDDNTFVNAAEFAPAGGNYTTSPAAAGLLNNTLYYWRVRASGDGGLTFGDWSTPSSFTTELGTPVLTAPGNASTDQSTTPTFAWTIPGSSAGIVFNLQYHTGGGFPGTTVSNVTSGYNGTTFNGNTTYTWRVVATKPSFTSKNAGQFTFTTLPSPVLGVPLNNSSGNSITPNFTWSWPGGGAPTYTIEIADDLAFTNIVYGPVVATSPHQILDADRLENGTIYYWRITATLPGPVVSSSIGQFSTIPQGLPVLSSPINSSTIVGNLINFKWSSAVSGLQYQVELDDNADFLSQVAGFPSALSSLSNYNLEYTLATLPAGTYYWRVKSFTSGGVKVTISPTWSFNIAGPPTASPIYPTNGEIIYTLYPTIYWQLNNNFNSTPAYSRVRVGTSPGGPYNTVVSVPTLNNYIVLSGLELATTYYYIIEVSTGLPFSTVTTSAEGSFAMLYASLANVPIYQTFPVTGTTVYSLTPTLYWFLGLHLPGVTFDLQIDDEPTFALPRVATAAGLTSLNYESPLLTAGSTYYWRVSINGAGTWYSQSFLVDANAVNTTTNAAVIPTPTAPAPTSGVVIFTQSPTLQWIATSTQPLEYQVIWSELPGLTAGVLTNITAPNGGQSGWLIINEYNVPGLAAGKTYYWQVRSRLASNNAVVSNYSSVAQFTVSPGASPVVVLPANPIVGASINSTTANLSWIVPAKSTSVITYDLELAKNKDMSDAIVVRDINKASYKVEGLNSSTTYYWRVQSKTSEGEKSDYSYLGEFNTGNGVTGITDEFELPALYSLEQNYPNPFNPTTTIKYSLPENSFVTIRIYDMLGREVNTLVNKEMTAGNHSINWNGEDYSGMKVTSGTYIYRITSGKFTSVKKMVLIK